MLSFRPTRTTSRLSIRHSSSKLGIKQLVQQDLRHAEKLGVIQPAAPDATALRKLVHTTIELAKFYFRGAKLIYTRGKEVNAIKARIRSGGFPLTRAEGRLIHLQRKDVTKLVPFIIMAIVLEELIPVAAIYAPFMLPSTCILPGQRSRIDEKKTRKATASAADASHVLAQIRKNAVNGTISSSALSGTGSASIICSLLRLPTFGNDFFRIWRIQRHLRFIQNDDSLILQDKLQDELNDHDLAWALEERGFIVQNLSPQARKAQLEWWLNSIKDTPHNSAVSRRIFLLTEGR
ncbi:hypothetical protein D9757_004370 [Collybiopsis confluens]|uniref:Letm1 RBD domain-containing protein n=1 Tax=Collybiopsis confluens TaxID=2823264 RepID=A0A8H5HTR7_9AGAR|nr:hypothetical protein D9757_004370 [Collybiopsis confluens]